MRIFDIFVIALTCLTSLLGAQGDSDEDDCEFIKSLPAKSDSKTLEFTVKDNTYPREYCAYWRIVGSRSEVIRIDVATIKQVAPGTCKDAYLKLDDYETEVIARGNSRFRMKGPQVTVFFRPDRCLQNFRLTYRSSVSHEGTVSDGDSSGLHDNDDDDNNSSSSTGTVVGAVIGCVLAVVLIVLICVLVFTCIRRRKAQQATPGDETSVHFWSKPNAYTPGTTVRPSTSRDASHEYDSLSVPASHKLGPAETGVYHNNVGLASNYSVAMAPVPPPYTGHPTNSVTESSHFSKEPPPSYSDVIQNK
ncbi:unnamed protein product [Candidula unifasciata]|uniref:CUB domain-containing protein n=1 Tax=Candidula unifasciata TaxID=100452 RepID=A0A8S3YXD1_9EUPU|nr:unnamed protein product [Candidula unifasciata]